MRQILACIGLALCCALPARAGDAGVEVCFDYGCHRSASARFSPADLEELRALLAPAADAAAERALLATAIGRMYAIVAAQTPIWRDRGRNSVDDRHLEGAMDCIDHSFNTAAFLRVLAAADLLRHHQPASREHRFAFLVFGEHWTASVTETASGARYAVDSWFFDPGTPATIVGLERWRAGYDPEQEVRAAR